LRGGGFAVRCLEMQAGYQRWIRCAIGRAERSPDMYAVPNSW